jgi:hypothetical protein
MLLTLAAAQLQRLCDFPTEGWEEKKGYGGCSALLLGHSLANPSG